MTSTNFTLILFITFLGYVYPKLMFVSEVCRHGPRTPSVVYNLTLEPYEDVGDKDKLQHFLIGAEVRRRYVLSEPLISSNYKNSEVFFRATNTKHAIESLECQLLGLYPQQECESKLNSHQQMKALPPFKFDGLDNILEELRDNSLPDCAVVPPIFSRNRLYDFKLGIHDSNCTGFKQLKLDLMNSAEYAQLQKPYTDLLLPIFTSEHVLKYICRDSQTHQCNSSNITDLDIHNICKFLVFANEYNLTLKFNFTSSDLSNCIKYLDQSMYYEVWGNEKLWKVGAKRYLEHLIDTMDKVLTNKQTEKLEINVGHDVTLELILNALGYEVRTSQPYSSLLFFELRIDDVTNQAYVNTIYNHTPLTYGLCTEINCPIEIFKENIVNRVQNGNIYEICEEPMMLKGVEDINPS